MEFSGNRGRTVNRKGIVRSAEENKTHLHVYQRRLLTRSKSQQEATPIVEIRKSKSGGYKKPPIQKSTSSRSEAENSVVVVIPRASNTNTNTEDNVNVSLHTQEEADDDNVIVIKNQLQSPDAEVVNTTTTAEQQIPANLNTSTVEHQIPADLKLNNNAEDDPVQPPTTPPPLSPNIPIPVWDNQLQEASFTKFQNIVDLVMWKDISKTAFVFGFGSFLLISSSLAKDVISFGMVSAISYIALFYLAATFFYKSIGNVANVKEFEDEGVLFGEEEAIWLLHFILPYLNGFLFNLKSLFSGDPATTFTLALLLFVFARSGNSLTLWIMAKSAFVAVFTLPKLWSLYSTQITRYGHFWVRRFGDAWDSCSHKKLVAAFAFTLVWNLSSITARIWAAFMLLVAVRYYQQSLCSLRGEWQEPDIN